MTLAIIISTLNEEKNIGTTLRCLERQVDRYKMQIDKSKYQVLVVDNGSTDDTVHIVENFKRESNLKISLINESKKGIVSARLAGVREVKKNLNNFINTKYLAFCDSDVILPDKWINSIFTGLEDKCADVLSYNGSFPHKFWMRVPNLVKKYINEIGTLFFPSETIWYYGADKKDVKLSHKIYSDFVRPPSGGFYAIRMKTYNFVGGYEREFTSEGKEVDGPTWRLYVKLMDAGANLKFIPNIEMINSERRLLGDHNKFFGIQEYDQLGDLKQDFRERNNDQYRYIDNLANSIDFEPVRRYAVEYYLLFPCVNRPELVWQNEEYFGSLRREIETDIYNWRRENNHPKGQDVFRFCDKLTDKYLNSLWHEISTRREEI